MSDVENTFDRVPLIGEDAWVAGETEQLVLVILDETLTPVDLSAYQWVALTVKKAPGLDDPALLQLAVHPLVSPTGAGIILRTQTGSNVGVLDVTATALQTATLGPGDFWFDVQACKGDGTVRFAIRPSPLEVVAPCTKAVA